MDDERPGQLRRTLGFWALTAYGTGDILGAGIYALVGEVAARASTAAWLSFAVTIGIAALTALSYAELGGRFPRAGGEAHFCELAFGWPPLALMTGWLVFASGMVSMATVSRAFAGYLLESWQKVPVWGEWLVLVGFVLLLGGINFWGIRQSSAFNIVCTLVEASGLLLVIVVGLTFLARSNAEPAAPPAGDGWTWLTIMQGSALAFFAFIGFEDMVNVSEEVKHPKRNLPAAILAAVAIAGSTYVVVAWVATRVIPPADLAASKAPLLEVVDRAAPWVPGWLFTVVALFAVANTGLLNFVMASRLLFGMARQRLLPMWLEAIHPRTHTPHRAIVVILVIVLILALSGTIADLAGATNVLLLLVFATVNVALIVLKLRHPKRRGRFHVPLVVPLAGTLTCLGLIGFVPSASLLVSCIMIGVGLLLVAAWWGRQWLGG